MNRFLLGACSVIACLCPLRAAGPGEFDLRTVLPLDSAQLTSLRALAAADPSAADRVAELRAETAPWLDAAPSPLAVIRYEGLVNTHPDRLADVEKLRSLDHVAALLRLWQATADEAAASSLRRHLLAWTSTYRPTGNDVNENKLAPLLVAALALRPRLAPDDLEVVDAWIRRIGDLHAGALATGGGHGNRLAKRLRLLALCAGWTGDAAWHETARARFHAYVADNLRPDGTSLDLEHRDSLTYHVSGLVSLLELLHSFGPDARDLYHWATPRGASVARSVRYVVPYATGEKTREEWKHSRVGLDRARAAAGLEEYRPGRLYEGRRAVPMLEFAARHDDTLPPVLARLRDASAPRFPTWDSLLNAALAAASSSAAQPAADSARADFEAPVIPPFKPADVAALRRLVATDPAAAALARARVETARALLEHMSRPLAVLHFDGLLDTDPRRRDTVERLQDIARLDSLLTASWVDHNPAFSAAAARILVAWTATHRPTGNATNDSKLVPLVVASRHLRPVLSPAELATADRWLDAFAAAALPRLDPASSRPKAIKLVAAVAWARDDEALRARAREALLAFVARDLRPNGASEVFERRDALSYHADGLRHLLEIADLTDPALYHATAPNGASIARSVAFLLPYVRGQKQHAEWVNSRSDLDRRRAAAGTAFYQPGRLFDPVEASPLLAEASRWDASLAAHVAPADAWAALVSVARREGSPVPAPAP